MTPSSGPHCYLIGGRNIPPLVPDGLVFPFWSLTKTALAICALKLVGAGRLSLDRRLSGEAFTLRQLLGHTSGLPDYGNLRSYQEAVARDEDPWPREMVRRLALAQGMLFRPSEGWAYSNIGYLLVRELVEETAGKPLAALVREMICEALGLASVRLAETRADLAPVHLDGARRYHPGWVYHGCLIGSVGDAARLLDGLLSGRLIDRALVAEMLVARPIGGAIPGRPWTETGYGLGLMIGRFGATVPVVGHTGGGAVQCRRGLSRGRS